MSHINTELGADANDSLLRALSRTPNVTPFEGTGRYRVCRCLGEGGFGVVYEVEDATLGRRLALKTLKGQRGDDPANIHRLKAEFRAVADLVHPNLVGLHELSSDDGRWFFTMDLVRGCDFLEYVCGETALAYAHTTVSGDVELPARRRDTSGILSEPRLRAVLKQLVAGVRALHDAGIVHRDLKPSNVLIEDDGRAVILDFGLAGSQVGGDIDHSMKGAGTPIYMAPEQASGRRITPAADWYAVGVMLYEALTGELPFDGATNLAVAHAKWTRDPAPPSSLCRVPEDLEALCLALLAREPEDRPDADAIVAMLGEVPAEADSRRGMHAELFVGRERELDELRGAYGTVRNGTPQLIRVHGQPGVGKSAMLAKLVAGLASDGDAVVLTAKCHEREVVPFKALDGVVDALQRYLRRLPRHEASALMPRDVHLLTQLFPVLAGVPAVRDVPRRQKSVLQPREARALAFEALKELLARVADKQPLVIVIDDLQWSDVDSARLLAQLVAPPNPPQMLLILAYRADEEARSVPLAETLRLLSAACGPSPVIDVQPLARAEAELFARALIEDTAASGKAARIVAERAEGHPMFMIELARELSLRAADDRVTPSLLDILWQRILHLPVGARALLETVAIAGQPRASALCFEAAGIQATGVEALRTLRADKLVRTGEGGTLAVYHDRIRDAVLERVDTGTCRMRHLALARTLERDPKADLEALARHFDAAEEHGRAARYAERAGDAAANTMAFERAAAMYELAVERSAEVSAALYRKLADALINDGRAPDAANAYFAAAERSKGAEAVDFLRLAAEHGLTVGAVDLGYDALHKALLGVGETLPASASMAKLELIYRMARVRLGGFRLREREPPSIDRAQLLKLDVLASAATALEGVDMRCAGAMAGRFCQLALRTGAPLYGAMALVDSVMAWLPGAKERPDTMDSVLDRAERIGAELGDERVLARAAYMRGKTYLSFGNWAMAAEHADRAIALAARRSDQATLGRGAATLAGCSRVRLGDLQGAREIGERMLLDAEVRRDPVSAKAIYGAVASPLALAADDPDTAAEMLARVAMEDRCFSLVFKAESTAAVAMYCGRPSDAVDAWHDRLERLEDYGLLLVPTFRVQMVRSLAPALVAHGERRGNVREAKRLARSIRPLRFAYARGSYALVQACLAWSEGELERAAELLNEAAALYDEAALVLDAAACRRRVGQLRDDRATVACADELLTSHGIVAPERWAQTVVPALQQL